MPPKKKPSPKLSPAIWRRVRSIEAEALYTVAMIELDPSYYDDQPTGEQLEPRAMQILTLCRLVRRLTGEPELRIQSAIKAERSKLRAELKDELPEEA